MKRAVVTGAAGFLGRHLASDLESKGYVVDRWTRSDWTLGEPVPHERLAGVDLMFHVAARVGDWGRRDDYFRENVRATGDLLEACETRGVRGFVYTSTPSVVMGREDLNGVDETVPMSTEPLSEYARSKALAETSVRAHQGEMKTIALRPHAIVGAGERHLLRRFEKLARLPMLPRIGDGSNLVHFCSIDTAVAAHRNAATLLLSERANSGRAVFVADGAPLRLWDVLRRLAKRQGHRLREVELPFEHAWSLATFAEWFHAPMPWWPPIINRYRVAMLGRSHWFDLSKMRSILGVEGADVEPAMTAALGAS